jgi:hypothetical protein
LYNADFFNNATLESIKDLGSLSKDLHFINHKGILEALERLNENSVNLSKEELKLLLEIKNLLLKKGIDENLSPALDTPVSTLSGTIEWGDENRLLLIENSSPQVRTYLHDLLIRSANSSNISEEDLYRIGNIFLYTISNLDIDGLMLRDIIQNMRESMVIYNTNQVFSILNSQVSSYNNYLENKGLATENQLQERVNEFNQEVDQRITLNKRRILYTGIGLLGSIALTSLGMPPLGGLLVRSITPPIINISSDSVEEVIRLRDVWDAALKKMLTIIKK